MRRLLLFVSIFSLLTIMATAQKDWVNFTSDSPQLPQVVIEEQNEDRVILDISIPGMFTSIVNEEEQSFQRLELMENWTTKDVGRPELPKLSELIGIPGNKLVRVNILEQETIKLDNYLIYPFQTPTTDNPGGHSHEFVMDNKFYNEGNTYPGNQVLLQKPGIWRDVKVTSLQFVPFNYNTATKELEVITHMKVEFEFYGTDQSMNLNRSKNVAPKFYNMYNKKISNFESLGYTMNFLSNDDIKYLIITNTEALNSIQPLVDWKNQQGFRVEVKTLETGFNTPQEFKDYISGLYDTDNLEYILMVGDAYPNGGNNGGPNDVPMYWWAPGGEDASYSDSWYSCMDGSDDHYADIAVGRFTYDQGQLDELDLQIQKTMDHYLNPDANTNWAENSILIAHKEQYPGKYTQCCEEIRTYPYSLQTPIFEQAYGGAGYSNDQVVNYVNTNSCGIFNYRGHGSATELWQWGNYGSFTAQHVNQLTNDERLFVFFDVCCDNMDIVGHSGDCLCESFMKSDVASVAVNGAIIPSYTIPNHDYDKEMYKAVFDEGIYNIGYVTNFANITVLDVHGTIGRSNVRTYLWLGDASIEPWTLQPADLTVTHDANIFLGLSEFAVTVMGTGGPLENAMVCVSNDDQSIYAVGYTDASGYVQIQFDGPVQDPGTAKVTVSAHNHLPYQSDVPVIPQSGPYIVQEAFTLNDQAGNGDGMMDYGESLLLSLSVTNVGITQAANVVVTLSTTDTYITFTDDSENYGNIEPDEIIEVTDAFAFDVANDIPDGHYALIEVEATDGTDTWTSNLSIQGHAPVLEFVEFLISDPSGNNNGKIDPGETVDFIVTIGNTGSSEAFNILGELSVIDPYLTLNAFEASFGNLTSGATAQGTFNATADITTPAGHLVNLDFDMTADLGIEGSGSFQVVIGQIPVLILDLDGNHNSASDMETCLQDMEIAFETLTSFPADPNLYSTIFVCLGIYSDNHTLSSSEGQELADYLNNGGNLYMEGGDTWYYDNQTPVHSMFNINGTSDGSSDLGTILGQTGTMTEGMSFNYSGDNSWIDHIEPISPAEMIFKNQSPSYGTGIAYDEGSYRTIGASHEFGGLDDAASPNTKEELMQLYLDFLGITTTLQAAFASNTTNTCVEEVIEYYDMSSGGAISWEWEFEGGSPATSSNQNPMVAYFNSGTFDVTLTISDGSESSTLLLEDYITVVESPEVPGTPAGDNEVTTNYTTSSEYVTTGANFADSYIWEISPAEAGSISGDGTTGTVEWTPWWIGTATITVKGMNEECGEGEFSEGFDVTCYLGTGIGETGDVVGIRVYPNPSAGQFTIKFDYNIGSTNIIVTNLLGEVIFEEMTETVGGRSLNINLSEYPEGIYFVKMKTDDSEQIKKVIIQ